jgi:hypothetical protein
MLHSARGQTRCMLNFQHGHQMLCARRSVMGRTGVSCDRLQRKFVAHWRPRQIKLSLPSTESGRYRARTPHTEMRTIATRSRQYRRSDASSVLPLKLSRSSRDRDARYFARDPYVDRICEVDRFIERSGFHRDDRGPLDLMPHARAAGRTEGTLHEVARIGSARPEPRRTLRYAQSATRNPQR